MAQNARKELLKIVEDFVGHDLKFMREQTDHDMSDLGLVVLVLERLVEVAEKVEDHTHTIN